MKKTVIAAAIVAAVGFSAYLGFRPDLTFSLPELQLANAEALSNDEQGGSSTSWTCWSQSKKSSGGFWRCGNPCMWIDGQNGTSGQETCK